MVTLPREVVERYERFSRYNSPYPAHDRGCAVDLYVGGGPGERRPAPSPVAGTVREVRTVRCPDRAYARDHDHLVVLELADPERYDAAPGTLARVLHVDPGVDPGDEVRVGDSLGRLVRSGFFGRWVADHLHLGFRAPGADARRASGSLPLAVAVDVAPLAWDGRGTVVETGPTHARLDAPPHPAPGERFVALGDAVGVDGGLPHYRHGGVFERAAGDRPESSPAEPTLLGTPLGDRAGSDVRWRDLAVHANGERVVGLSLFASRVDFGAKLVAFDHSLSVGDEVRVAIRPVDEPFHLD
jgi:hypothetical protein